MLGRCALLGAALAALVAAPALADTRVALVIGNADYENVRDLSNPLNDARGMKAALEKVGFRVVYGENLGKRDMERAVGRFAKESQQADVALVYYSGHGSTFGEVPYAVPVDARYDSLEQVKHELVPIEEMIGELRRAKGVRLAILDACRDNEAEQQLKQSGGATRSLGQTRGLGRIGNPDGLIIAYSTQHLTTALDGDPGRNSPFTGALLKHLPTPGLDVKAMLFKTAQDVVVATKGGQRPEVQVSLYQDYALIPASAPGGGPPVATLAPAGPGEEAQFWQTLRLRVTSDGLEDYLAKVDRKVFPGAFAALAREELALFAAAEKQRRARGGRTTDCDLLAAHPDDPDRPDAVAGVPFEKIDARKAAAACERAAKASPSVARFVFQLGRAKEKAGDAAGALALFEKSAAAGSVAGMTAVGRFHNLGSGTPEDPAKARLWYERAIGLDHAPALNNLAVMVERGEGGPVDAPRAAALFLESVRRGNPHTLAMLRDKPELFALGVRLAMQALLADQGLGGGERDGRLGPQTLAAIDVVARSAGAR